MFALTLPFALFWGLGVPFDVEISSAFAWGPFVFACGFASLALTSVFAYLRPEWLVVPRELSLRTVVGLLAVGSAASYAGAAVLIGFAIWALSPPDEHALLIALWLPLWSALPLGAIVASRMARRPTRQ